MRLFIAEKPSVAKAIAGELGQTGRGDGFIECNSDVVTWCFGHMLEQAEPDVYLPEDVPRNQSGKKIWRAEDLPIIPDTWITEPKSDAKQQLAAIGRLLKKATLIVNAGDPDREGQLLVDAVLEYFRNTRPVKRFWVSAQDSVSVQRGLAALKDNEGYAGCGAAALARGRADWLIGMNLSRAYTLRSQRGGGQAVLSIGRVQTPTLALVVARDREIEGFKPVDYFNIAGTFQHANGIFTAKWMPKEDQAGMDSESRLIDKQVAEGIVQAATGQTGHVIEHTDTPKKDQHPRAFALSDITLLASKKFGSSAEEVLKVCQSLYETHKLTSYPRTDCDYLPESQHEDAPQVLAALKKVNPDLVRIIDACDPTIKSKTWNDAKITAHHGIIPTMHAGDASALSVSERNVYNLIVRAYLAQFFPVHEYMSTKIIVEVAGEVFGVTGKTVTRKGWRAVYNEQSEEEGAEEEGENRALPAVKKGDSAACQKATLEPTKSTPPARFTEGTLGKAMESIHKFVTDPEHKKILKEGDGIGTSATRASIITELKNKKFLETKGKAIVSTQLGRGLIDVLPEVIRSPVLTALYERMLKKIEQGESSLADFMAKQEQFIRDQVAKANDGSITVAGSAAPACPKCKAGFLRRFPRKNSNGFFWSCTRYQEGCDASFDDKAGKPVPKVPVTVSQIHKCGACGCGLIRRQGTKRPGKPALPWWSCSGYPECKQSYPDLKGKPDFNFSRR
ncbi:DNA topoisomerase III [Azotobacter chroococcum]|uniref:DNA topoisomerase n=1 Tax=Azotobacter chroococcum NCIMB 8003 TaxID=1328314 RepID=A0A0C4WS02_9GAMM|nr:DNA topoisomerase 3 [Azotobacter chroococcum]AJE23501.1 Prokaryotic type I DNA topoisomerase [Azotobacter chroococcum NCIMB 8003]